MKVSVFEISRNTACLLAAAFLCALPAGAALPSGSDYQMMSSVVDNGGGINLIGGEYLVKGSVGQTSIPSDLTGSNGGGYANRAGFYNPPHFTYQAGLPISFSMASDDVHVTLPANAVPNEVFDITINKDPLSQPLIVDPAKITDANNKMVNNKGAWAQVYPATLSEMAIFDEQEFYTKPLVHSGVISIRYRDDNGDGLLDGSNPPVRVDTLNAWKLDETLDSWVRLRGTGSGSDNMLTSYFDKPGVYSLIGSLDPSVADVSAYPVPFRPNGPQAGIGRGRTGTEAAGITFNNLPQNGNIEVYTLDGRLVRKLAIPNSGTDLNWDVKTGSGERVASGVYIWRVVSSGNSKTGKLMVIW